MNYKKVGFDADYDTYLVSRVYQMPAFSNYSQSYYANKIQLIKFCLLPRDRQVKSRLKSPLLKVFHSLLANCSFAMLEHTSLPS